MALLIALLCGRTASASDNWRIVKDHWSAADETGFGRFVALIGKSGCSSSQSCLRDPANPYRASDGHFVDIDADCAKWPYLLRAYYAWKNGLPFSYVDAVSGEGSDLRYSRTSNRPVSRHDIVDHGGGIDAPSAVRQMMASVYSATYRTDVATEHAVASDFYPPALRPRSIRPGSLLYDINGHVGIVYKVDRDGRIYYMDAHPDFTVTRSVYGAQFGQSTAALGGGLKNWRPLWLSSARRGAGGSFVGGHIVMARNDQIPDLSLVQYQGTHSGRFIYNGQALGFYEYVRVAVSGGRTTFNPIFELKATLSSLCNDLNDRAQYVDLAIKDRIADRPHPSRIPADIYGEGDATWSAYSTPARDARLRAAFLQFHTDLAQMIDLWLKRDPRIVYDGQFLQADLRDAYQAQSQACTITYLNSQKHPVAITLDDMLGRLFKLSFDPYHCVELRWGADGSERDSCPDGAAKLKWYTAEQGARTDSESSGARHRAVASAPLSILAEIDAMPERDPLEPMAPVGR